MTDPKFFQFLGEQVVDYAVFLLAPDGKVMSWGLGAERINGYRADEIIGRHFSVFYPPDAQASGWPASELEYATKEGRFEDEGFRVRKDGTRFWANVVITALRDETGKLVAFSKITRDLTDRRMQEEALRQSEERFRLLVEGVVDYAIYMLDPSGIVTSWNLGAERITGYYRDEIIGKHFSNFFPAEDVADGKPWAELAHARQNGRFEDEGWRIRRNGERFWARAIITGLYDSRGHLRGFAKVTQDLSLRRNLEELQSATEKLNEFIATLAHEIRNPLAPISNALSLMQRVRPDDPAQVEMRDVIGRQAKRLTRIADDMLDISRITRGQLVIQSQVIDVGVLIRNAVEAALPTIEEAGHSLTVELPTETVLIKGDMERLVQVLSNLLNNAARFTHRRGTITIKGWRERGDLAISVRDTGRGIAKEDLASIFRMFVHGREPIQRIGAGLGVGLALARGIVELHGGRLEVSSKGPGQGSEFTVHLPAHEALVSDQPKTLSETATVDKMTPRRVLIVDDNADAADSLLMLMKALGHDAMVAYDGREAVKVFDEFRPQLILLDIGLPGMSGYEVARLLRSRKDGENVRIVAVTGWGQADDRRQSHEAGIDLHLVKPIDEKQLREALMQTSNGNTLH
jgi:PAS domain S-box-containing protein